MKQKTALITIGAGALALVVYYFTRLKKTLTNLNVSVFGAKYNSQRTQNSLFLKIWFELKLKVDNPTDRQVMVNETLLDFYISGKKVGEVRNFDKLTINPKTYSYLVIPTYMETLSIFSLVSNFLEAVRSGTPLKIGVKGSINLEGNMAKIDEVVNLDTKPIQSGLTFLQNIFKR